MARTDPFNYILEMEMSICLKQQLGETFWMEEVLQCKGKQTRGRRILLAKLSSTKTLFIKNGIITSLGGARFSTPLVLKELREHPYIT